MCDFNGLVDLIQYQILNILHYGLKKIDYLVKIFWVLSRFLNNIGIMDANFKRRLEEYFCIDHEGLFWTSIDELNAHPGFKAHMKSLGRQRLVEPFELISQWIAYNNLVVRRLSHQEFEELTYDKKRGERKPEPNWMKLQRFVQMIPLDPAKK